MLFLIDASTGNTSLSFNSAVMLVAVVPSSVSMSIRIIKRHNSICMRYHCRKPSFIIDLMSTGNAWFIYMLTTSCYSNYFIVT